jgi:integrase
MLITVVDSYLTLRRATGVKLAETERTLRAFALFAEARGESFIRSATVLDWVRAKSPSPHMRAYRLKLIIPFARYLRAEDPRHEVPPRDVFGRHPSRRLPPFLFSTQEVKALVREALNLGPEGAFQPLVYSTLFGLLACTGLRVSEAFDLSVSDVTNEGLIVRKAKFGKSRMLPLHPTPKKQLERFIERRCQIAGGCEFLFPSMRARRLKHSTVFQIFHQLIRSAGIPERQGRRPRIHDLRFHFANQAMASSPGTHEGISKHMVALATYLGHCTMLETDWYLEATPGLMTQIAARCEDAMRGSDL